MKIHDKNYYHNPLKLRRAVKNEIGWINKCYDEVEFLPSNFENEIIVIAELDGQKAGLGRLVKIDQKHFELGGIYVFDAFRGKGVGKEIVKFLLQYVKPLQIVYCIPFENLISLYQQCGFSSCIELEQTPKILLEKYHWCKEKYNQPISLFSIG